MNATEQRLRKHIRRVILKTNRGKNLSRYDLQQAENETLRLFQKYSHAPKEERDRIWAEGKTRIKKALRERAVSA